MDLRKKKRMSISLLILISLPLLIAMNNAGKINNFKLLSVLADYYSYIPIVGNSDIDVVPTPTHSASTATPTSTQGPGPTNTPIPSSTPINPPNDGIWVDHNSVALFDSIPPEYLEAAKNLRMLFSDRSVGANIDTSLNCLSASSWVESPNYCRVDYYDNQWHFRSFYQEDLDQGLVPDRILFEPDPITYNRDNWTYEFKTGTWSDLTEDFITVLAPSYINSKDVLSYQFSYVNMGERVDISDPDTGFFANTPSSYDVYDLEAYIAQHPDKTFIFWTTSLARSLGSQTSTDFNNMMRQYAIDHDKILFDVADIEAHTDLGISCFDHRDGVEYCDQNSGNCENFPDDGLDIPAICQDWTTEIHEGHLGSVSGGQIMIAKAFWVLMAQIAGWVP